MSTFVGGRVIGSSAVAPPASADPVDRFFVLFEDELDEIRRLCSAVADGGDTASQATEIEDVARAFGEISAGADRGNMIAHHDLADRLSLSGPRTWNVASVLEEFGEVYRSRDREHRWWWIRAPALLAEKCKQRSISIRRYMLMAPELEQAQEEMVRWYEIRQMHGNLQPRTMHEIKVANCKRLQERYYPDKPLDPGAWTDHVVSSYLRTAQDMIIAARDLSY